MLAPPLDASPAPVVVTAAVPPEPTAPRLPAAPLPAPTEPAPAPRSSGRWSLGVGLGIVGLAAFGLLAWPAARRTDTASPALLNAAPSTVAPEAPRPAAEAPAAAPSGAASVVSAAPVASVAPLASAAPVASAPSADPPPAEPARSQPRAAAAEDSTSPQGARFPGSFLRNAVEPTGWTVGEVDSLVADLQRCGGTIELVGHACALGDGATNMGMGWLRADAVRRILVERGVAADRVRVRTSGSSVPLASNEVEERRLVNRRVMVICRAP